MNNDELIKNTLTAMYICNEEIKAYERLIKKLEGRYIEADSIIAKSNKVFDKMNMLVNNLYIEMRHIYGNEYKKITISYKTGNYLVVKVIGYEKKAMIYGTPLLKITLK